MSWHEGGGGYIGYESFLVDQSHTCAAQQLSQTPLFTPGLREEDTPALCFQGVLPPLSGVYKNGSSFLFEC